MNSPRVPLSSLARQLLIQQDQASALRLLALRNPDRYHFSFADFFSTNPNANGWGSNSSGAGAGISAGWSLLSASYPAFGIADLKTGTTATGLYSLTTFNDVFTKGVGEVVVSSRVTVGALSTASEEYNLVFGLVRDGHSAGLAAKTRSLGHFAYRRATSGTNWRCITVDGGAETETDSGVAVVAGNPGWTILEVRLNAAGSSVGFYINGTLVATHTTAISTWSPGISLSIEKTVGTTSRSLYVDWTRVEFYRETPR